MKSITSLIFCSVFLLISCKAVLIKTYGIQQPKIENQETLKQFLVKNGFKDDLQIFTFKDMNAFHKAMNTTSVPNAKFFNKDGYFVSYQLSPEDCNAKVGPFIESAENINSLGFDESIKVEDFLTDIVELDTKAPFEIEEDVDAYLVLYWAKFIGGKLNRDKSLDWIQIYEEAVQNGSKIQLVFLNMDYQEFWGITKDDLPEFEF